MHTLTRWIEGKEEEKEILIHATPIAYVDTIPPYGATITHLLECNCGSDEMASVDSIISVSVRFVKITSRTKQRTIFLTRQLASRRSRTINKGQTNDAISLFRKVFSGIPYIVYSKILLRIFFMHHALNIISNLNVIKRNICNRWKER